MRVLNNLNVIICLLENYRMDFVVEKDLIISSNVLILFDVLVI